MLYWENSHNFEVYFTRLCFELNNLTGQKFGMSELKLSWPVTLTGVPPAVISRPASARKKLLTRWCSGVASPTIWSCYANIKSFISSEIDCFHSL
jgi:hypothetical protein